jgi:hypothetical protein
METTAAETTAAVAIKQRLNRINSGPALPERAFLPSEASNR